MRKNSIQLHALAHPVMYGHESWTQPLNVGQWYLAYVTASGEFDGQVPALIKGEINGYNDLPSNYEEGDCWFVRSEFKYVMVTGDAWRDVLGMADL